MDVISIFVGLLIFLFVVAVLFAIMNAGAAERAREEYQQALSKLTLDPHNPQLKQQAVSLGRIAMDATRRENSQGGMEAIDELAIANDIAAATAAAGRPTEPDILETKLIETESVAKRLEKLTLLWKSGAIDDSEYNACRTRILNEL